MTVGFHLRHGADAAHLAVFHQLVVDVLGLEDERRDPAWLTLRGHIEVAVRPGSDADSLRRRLRRVDHLYRLQRALVARPPLEDTAHGVAAEVVALGAAHVGVLAFHVLPPGPGAGVGRRLLVVGDAIEGRLEGAQPVSVQPGSEYRHLGGHLVEAGGLRFLALGQRLDAGRGVDAEVLAQHRCVDLAAVLNDLLVLLGQLGGRLEQHAQLDVDLAGTVRVAEVRAWFGDQLAVALYGQLAQLGDADADPEAAVVALHVGQAEGVAHAVGLHVHAADVQLLGHLAVDSRQPQHGALQAEGVRQQEQVQALGA